MKRLLESPRLQAIAASRTSYTPSVWLLEQELRAGDKCADRPWAQKAPDDVTVADIYKAAKEADNTGLCLSGGGIRSATFNLGILQGLSRLRALDKVDYLSSVSGGGYIHQFLAAWLRNYEKYAPASKKSADILEFVEEQLTPLPQETGADHQTEQPEPVRWLRRYSNYLTPRTGLLSADTWVVAAIWLRNTFLNQLVLIASLAALLAIPDLFTPTHCSTKYLPKLYSAWDFAIPATGIVILAGFVVWRSIVLLATRQTEEEGSAEKETGFFCGRKVVPGLLMAVSILASPVVYRSTFPNVSMVTGPSNEPATENAQGQLKAGNISLSITLTAKQENGTKAPGQVDSHGLAGCGGPAGKRRRQRSAA